MPVILRRTILPILALVALAVAASLVAAHKPAKAAEAAAAQSAADVATLEPKTALHLSSSASGAAQTAGFDMCDGFSSGSGGVGVAYGRSWQSCEGTDGIEMQRQTPTLFECTTVIAGWCILPVNLGALGTCVIWGPGFFKCPSDGGSLSRQVGPGDYWIVTYHDVTIGGAVFTGTSTSAVFHVG
jgi:hypothetical protein